MRRIPRPGARSAVTTPAPAARARNTSTATALTPERALIEDVRVARAHRGHKIGHRLLEWAISEARRRHCRLIELFVHETRSSARRFYSQLGLKDSHRGMRLPLE
ncbi:GNAT family N-acetyltransferase [Taklimakanibacter lacteus]|uniref:GNAT family N-acetyltransferase n=1 Tax=Taklimakanibacter lacteus TaxID=2268456 RepID=UPI0034D6E6CA